MTCSNELWASPKEGDLQICEILAEPGNLQCLPKSSHLYIYTYNHMYYIYTYIYILDAFIWTGFFNESDKQHQYSVAKGALKNPGCSQVIFLVLKKKLMFQGTIGCTPKAYIGISHRGTLVGVHPCLSPECW